MKISSYIKNNKSIEGYGIEPNKPTDLTPFFVVCEVPKLLAGQLWYRCSYCERNEQFKSGKIILCADKKLRLIGDICWKEFYDQEEWHKKNKESQIYNQRQRFLQLKDEYLPLLRNLRSMLLKNKTYLQPYAKFMDSFATDFKARFPELFAALEDANKDNYNLKVEVIGKDINGNQVRQYQTIATINGMAALISKKIGLLEEFDNEIEELDQLGEEFRKTKWEEISYSKFESEFKTFHNNISKVLTNISSLNESIMSVVIFLGERNIRGVVNWANHANSPLFQKGRTYRLERNGIANQNSAIRLPPTFSFDGMSEIKIAKDGLNKLI